MNSARTTLALSLRITNTRDNTVLDRVFDHFPVRIGRSALNDLALEFKFVSQFHALIEKMESGSVSVRDLGSRNGVTIGGRPLQPHQRFDLASSGYTFEIGPLRFQGALGMAAKQAGDERTAVMVALSEDPAAQNATEMWQAIVAAPAQQRTRDPRDVALMGLRQLAATYMPKAGPLEDAESIIRFLSKVKQALDLLFGAFLPLRDGSRQILLQADAAARGEQDAWGAAASAKTPLELAAKALDWRDPSNDVLRAIQNAFADFVIHQVTMVDSLVRGLGTVLSQFSRAALEARFAKEGSSMRFGAFKDSALLRVSLERQRELIENVSGALSEIFGEEFVRAFLEAMRGGNPS